MTRWKKFWADFDGLMRSLPGVIEEAIDSGIDGAVTSVITNGDVVLRGKFRSLRINGYRVNVPDYVMLGKLKPK